jgi:hypothetical protein
VKLRQANEFDVSNCKVQKPNEGAEAGSEIVRQTKQEPFDRLGMPFNNEIQQSRGWSIPIENAIVLQKSKDELATRQTLLEWPDSTVAEVQSSNLS